MFKKILFPLVALFMLAGCAKPPTTIEVSPTITLPQQDPSLMGVTVSINGADQRTDQALAKVTRDNQIVTLTASRDLRFLLQEVLEKQMTARGYMVGPNGPVNLQIIVSQLYADVSQGNVRYNIATKADIAIIATAKNGNKTWSIEVGYHERPGCVLYWMPLPIPTELGHFETTPGKNPLYGCKIWVDNKTGEKRCLP